MKILKQKYPKGTFKYQKTDGRYIDDNLYDNLKLLANKIVDDMTFMGLCSSSTLEVGTGKSVLMTQIGEAWSELIKNKHNIDIPFTQNNIVFRPEDLVERSFKLPKYSLILLDEWEDINYWSTLGKTLRKFFRKCRQLNLFMICICPNFFQFPISYAISRSAFFIDVKFDNNLDRGNFDFYGFKAKKDLYMKGKKFHNYAVQKPDFDGKFQDGYGVPEEEYRKAKMRDMLKYDDEEQKKLTEHEIRVILFKQLRTNLTELSQKRLCQGFGISERTGTRWIQSDIGGNSSPISSDTDIQTSYNKLELKNNSQSDGDEEDDRLF